MAACHSEEDSNTGKNRTGVLCMILCAALGIANIFTLHAWHIVFAVLCMSVQPYPLQQCDTNPQQYFRPYHPLRRSALPSPHLPDLRQVR